MDIKSVNDVPQWRLTPGVRGKVVLSGEHIMLFLVEMKGGSSIPYHRHPNEQMGLCLKGKAIFKTEKEENIIEEGITYRFPPNEEHSVEALDHSRFLDVFAPPRKDYLKKQ